MISPPRDQLFHLVLVTPVHRAAKLTELLGVPPVATDDGVGLAAFRCEAYLDGLLAVCDQFAIWTGKRFPEVKTYAGLKLWLKINAPYFDTVLRTTVTVGSTPPPLPETDPCPAR